MSSPVAGSRYWTRLVGQLGQLLDPDARVAQDLDGRPGPEPAVLFESEVEAFPGGGVVGPDAGAGPARHHRPAEVLPGRGEELAGGRSPRGCEPLRGSQAPFIGCGG
jgi:hypothetical protein